MAAVLLISKITKICYQIINIQHNLWLSVLPVKPWKNTDWTMGICYLNWLQMLTKHILSCNHGLYQRRTAKPDGLCIRIRFILLFLRGIFDHQMYNWKWLNVRTMSLVFIQYPKFRLFESGFKSFGFMMNPVSKVKENWIHHEPSTNRIQIIETLCFD